MSDVAAEAKYLMNNHAFVAALNEAKRQTLAAALACDEKDDQGRRRYLDAWRTVDKVAAHLNALMATDKPKDEDVSSFYEDQAKRRWTAWTDFLAK